MSVGDSGLNAFLALLGEDDEDETTAAAAAASDEASFVSAASHLSTSTAEPDELLLPADRTLQDDEVDNTQGMQNEMSELQARMDTLQQKMQQRQAQKTNSSNNNGSKSALPSKKTSDNSASSTTAAATSKNKSAAAAEGKSVANPKCRLVDVDFSKDTECRSRAELLAVARRDLFGSVSEDDDEDEENMPGKEQLSAAGEQLAGALAKSSAATADEQQQQGSRLPQARPPRRVSPTKAAFSAMSRSGQDKQTTAVKVDVYDAYFGIRVRNVRVSSMAFASYTDDNRRLRMSALGLKAPADDSGGWVSMAVVVQRSSTQTSANGNQYCTWHLHDLGDCNIKPVKFWLFADAHKRHWKLPVGTVVAVLNAQPMQHDPQKQNASSSVGVCQYRLVKGTQVVELGTAVDLATCAGRRQKDGQPCTNFVNRAVSDYCTFHLMSASRAMAARRGELQSLSQAPNSLANNNANRQAAAAARRAAPVNGLTSVTQARRVSAQPLTIEQIRTHNSKRTGSGLPPAAPGSSSSTVSSKIASSSLTASQEKDKQAVRQAFLQRIQKPTLASRQFQKSLGALTSEVGTRTMKENMQRSTASGNGLTASVTEFLDANRVPARSPAKPAAVVRRPAASPAKQHIDRAKLNAINVIRRAGVAAGGATSSKRPEKRARPADSSAGETDSATSMVELSPLKKVGRRPFTSEQLKQMCNVKSLFDKQLDQEDREKQERYFCLMEGKEKVDERLVNTFEIKNVNVITCDKCQYTFHKQSAFCLEQRHAVRRHQANRRYFKCAACKHRALTYYLMPKRPCNKCGGTSFERTGMKDMAKGPKLASETLLVRGEERKFINS